ncbi:hypothetical protein RB597_000485 [Gaeumannomyces tritici]
MSSDSGTSPTTDRPGSPTPTTTTATGALTPSRTSSATASTASTESTTSTARTASPRPQPTRSQSISDPNLHVCFICLLNSNETPRATWVNACPCTLEAHEDCMLKWVAQMEASGSPGGGRRGSRNKGGLRCPACKGAIQVFEPFDPMMWLRDRAHRAFSRTSPIILLSMMGSFAVAGSAHYGITAMSLFAGGNTTMAWLRVGDMSRRPPGLVWWRHAPTYAFVSRAWLLHLLMPGLLLNKAIPGIDTYLLLPVSLAYGFSLAARDQMPIWPLSPEWTMTVMPCISLSYCHMYYEFFGRFERRLNQTLRGNQVLDETEVRQPPEQQERQQGRQQRAGNRGGANNNNNNNNNNENNIGIGTAIFRLAGAFVNIFLEDAIDLGDDDEEEGDDGEGLLEVEVGVDEDGRLQIEVHDEEGAVVLEGDAEARAVLEEAIQAVQADMNVEVTAERGQEPAAAAAAAAAATTPPQLQEIVPEAPVAAVAEAPAVDAMPADPPPAIDAGQENRDRPQWQRQVGASSTGGTWSRIINGTVSALLLPHISYVMGELLRVTLPSRWVRSPAWGKPRGLLQHRWGRSLMGGCLFVVLRDAFLLYFKYRQVELRKNRRVKNVERRVGGRRGASTSAAS